MKNIPDVIALRVLVVAFDVSSEKLDYSFMLKSQVISDGCSNDTDSIRATLQSLQKLAEEHRYQEIRVVCESTGVYHRSLLRVASQLGMRTNLAGGEAVAAQRKVRFNDTGKTDSRDSEAILDVGHHGRLLKHRQFEDQFQPLRELHRLVLRYERKHLAIRNELHAELRLLFPDLRLHKDVLFGPTGRALFEAFGANPQRIVTAGRAKFEQRIKKLSRYTKRATLAKIWDQAVSSVSQAQASEVLSIREQYATQLYADIAAFKEKKEQLESRMIDIYQQLQSQDGRLPAAQKGVVTWRMLARLMAEVGPLDDFRSWRQLMRYAGLNLLERQSGKFKGQIKISRRGRSAIRHVLNKICLSLVQRQRLYGPYYRRKKDDDRMPGDKAMTCVMRKFLKMLYGWSQSGQQFDQVRVFQQKNKVMAA